MELASGRDPAHVVDRQLAAYNARDADAFAATYAESAKVFRAGTGEVELQGRQAIRDHYRTRTFLRSGLQALVAHRMVVGDMVVLHERIVWDERPAPLEAVVVYQVAGGLIQNAWLFDVA